MLLPYPLAYVRWPLADYSNSIKKLIIKRLIYHSCPYLILLAPSFRLEVGHMQ